MQYVPPPWTVENPLNGPCAALSPADLDGHCDSIEPTIRCDALISFHHDDAYLYHDDGNDYDDEYDDDPGVDDCVPGDQEDGRCDADGIDGAENIVHEDGIKHTRISFHWMHGATCTILLDDSPHVFDRSSTISQVCDALPHEEAHVYRSSSTAHCDALEEEVDGECSLASLFASDGDGSVMLRCTSLDHAVVEYTILPLTPFYGIARWLDRIGYASLATCFLRHGIVDVLTLPFVDDDVLITIGVSNVCDRMSILREVIRMRRAPHTAFVAEWLTSLCGAVDHEAVMRAGLSLPQALFITTSAAHRIMRPQARKTNVKRLMGLIEQSRNATSRLATKQWLESLGLEHSHAAQSLTRKLRVPYYLLPFLGSASALRLCGILNSTDAQHSSTTSTTTTQENALLLAIDGVRSTVAYKVCAFSYWLQDLGLQRYVCAFARHQCGVDFVEAITTTLTVPGVRAMLVEEGCSSITGPAGPMERVEASLRCMQEMIRQIESSSTHPSPSPSSPFNECVVDDAAGYPWCTRMDSAALGLQRGALFDNIHTRSPLLLERMAHTASALQQRMVEPSAITTSSTLCSTRGPLLYATDRNSPLMGKLPMGSPMVSPTQSSLSAISTISEEDQCGRPPLLFRDIFCLSLPPVTVRENIKRSHTRTTGMRSNRPIDTRPNRPIDTRPLEDLLAYIGEEPESNVSNGGKRNHHHRKRRGTAAHHKSSGKPSNKSLVVSGSTRPIDEKDVRNKSIECATTSSPQTPSMVFDDDAQATLDAEVEAFRNRLMAGKRERSLSADRPHAKAKATHVDWSSVFSNMARTKNSMIDEKEEEKKKKDHHSTRMKQSLSHNSNNAMDEGEDEAENNAPIRSDVQRRAKLLRYPV